MQVDIKKEIKAPLGVYVLFGEEDYLKRFYAGKLRQAVDEDSPFAVFNYLRFSPKDFEGDRLRAALDTPPMGGGKKVIELCEFSFAEPRAAGKSAETEALIEFLSAAAAAEDTVVILPLASDAFDYGTLGGKHPKPSSLYKKLDAVCKMVYLPHATARELCGWILRHFAAEKIFAAQDVAAHLIEISGSDMMTLSGEIEKLSAYLHAQGRDTLTAQDVEAVACKNQTEEPFGLSNAILARDADRALKMLSVMEREETPPMKAFAGVYSTYIDLYRIRACMDAGQPAGEIATALKMNEYRVKIYMQAASRVPLQKLSAILDLMREADFAVKSSGNDYGRLRRLVLEAVSR
ncbi:MAG: DNA polymerase III subunit delta [Clostridia bacterium]|nr:DNA polymerase III subunit delta [Clostridia bacterium]